MRKLIIPALGAILIMAVFSSCTTTVRTPGGRTTSVSTRTQ
ncbi:MAG TPA: hypothetical protein VF683_11800 [Chthoniobacterales bacterium]